MAIIGSIVNDGIKDTAILKKCQLKLETLDRSRFFLSLDPRRIPLKKLCLIRIFLKKKVDKSNYLCHSYWGDRF